MLIRHWLQFLGILAGMAAAARFMYLCMRFAVRVIIPEIIPSELSDKPAVQVYVLCIEAFLLKFPNEMRRHVITESFASLPAHFLRRFTWLVAYATVLWLVAMSYLSWMLWSAPWVFDLHILCQLLLITVGMGIMMGITLPFCNLRFWEGIYAAWKNRKGGPKR